MTMSGILDRLEKRGLIERYADPNDSRAKLARMTKAGEELVDVARNVGLAMYENALNGLSAEDRAQIVAGLQHIRDNLNNMTAEQKEAV
jgi:DNA-binding MarR family transcriptional regulator